MLVVIKVKGLYIIYLWNFCLVFSGLNWLWVAQTMGNETRDKETVIVIKQSHTSLCWFDAYRWKYWLVSLCLTSMSNFLKVISHSHQWGFQFLHILVHTCLIFVLFPFGCLLSHSSKYVVVPHYSFGLHFSSDRQWASSDVPFVDLCTSSLEEWAYTSFLPPSLLPC